MNASDLIAKIAEQSSVTKTETKSIIEGFLREIVASASSGQEVSLPGFGKFKVKQTAAREGRNPSTGQVVQIPASKKLSFAPSKTVKDQMNAA